MVKKKKNPGNFHQNSSVCNLPQPHRLPQIFFLSLSLTSAVIPVKLPPTQKHLQKIKSACWCVVCRAFTCLTDTQGEGKGIRREWGEERGRAREKERQLVTKLLHIDRDRFFFFFFGFASKVKHRRSLAGSVTHSGTFLRTDGEVYY